MQKISLNNSQTNIIGNNILSYRKSMQLTQQDIAEYLGVTRPYITAFEKGNREVSMIHLIKLANLFYIDVSDLLEENESIKSLNSLVAFKKDSLEKNDLNAIADFRKIVKNYLKLSRNE